MYHHIDRDLAYLVMRRARMDAVEFNEEFPGEPVGVDWAAEHWRMSIEYRDIGIDDQETDGEAWELYWNTIKSR